MFLKKNLSKLIIFTPIILIVLVTTLVTFSQIQHLEKRFSNDRERLKKKLIDEKRDNLSKQIDVISNYIECQKSTNIKNLEEQIKKRVEITYRYISSNYNKSAGIIDHEKIQEEVINRLNKVKYDNGHFFLKEIHKDKKLGFINDYSEKIDTLNNLQKISYIKKFKHFNWILGYERYFIDTDRVIKQNIIEKLNSINFKNQDSIYIIDFNKNIIQGKEDKNFLYKELYSFIDKSIEKNKFNKIHFYWPRNYEKLFVYKIIPDFNWVIIANLDLKNLEDMILSILGTKQQEEDKFIRNSIQIALVVIIFGSLLTLIITKKIKLIFKNYKNSIEMQKSALKNINATLAIQVKDKTKELEELNNKLKDKIKEEVNKNREKDKILYQQSKMAAMGEMIENIAHQWRQPLSTISTAASGISLKIDFKIYDEEEIKKDLKSIVDTTLYLSQTIEDFRNFFIDNKNKEKFNLVTFIKKDINIINSQLKSNSIELITSLEDITIFGIKNELTQAIINILTNAKDVLVEKINCSEKRRIIKIETKAKDKFAYIYIQDNAEGIKKEIIDKVFEAYFTTKHKSQGTGIGLYMTREIIVKHMKGQISVKNRSFEHENITYFGACFEIKLPVNNKVV